MRLDVLGWVDMGDSLLLEEGGRGEEGWRWDQRRGGRGLQSGYKVNLKILKKKERKKTKSLHTHLKKAAYAFSCSFFS